jgi:hypothetical protein
MRGRRDDEDDDRALSPTSRGHTTREKFPHRFARISFVRSPRARPGKLGIAWARQMDEGPNPGENENPKTRLSFFTVQMKKIGARSLAGLVAGDALRCTSLTDRRVAGPSRRRRCRPRVPQSDAGYAEARSRLPPSSPIRRIFFPGPDQPSGRAEVSSTLGVPNTELLLELQHAAPLFLLSHTLSNSLFSLSQEQTHSQGRNTIL